MSPGNRDGFAANPQNVPFDEWWRLWHFVNAFEAKDNGWFRMWLEVAGGRRVWHISSSRFHFEYVAVESGVVGSFRVPFTARAANAITDVAKSETDGRLSLGDDESFVITFPDVTLAYDLPAFEPGQVFELESVECTARVSGARLADILDAARTPPIGVDFPGYGPPLWCVVENGRVAFHSDWSGQAQGRATVSVSAETDGTASFHSAVSIVARVLRDFTTSDDGDDTIEFQIDGPNGSGCRVVGKGWTLTCPFIDPVALEWGSSMRRELSNAGIDVTRDGDRAVEFLVDLVQIRAEVHGGRHPICRLSATITRGIDCSDFLLSELNDWNKGHAGVKFWWENDKVVAVVDLDCNHMADIAGESRRLAFIVGCLAPATSSL